MIKPAGDNISLNILISPDLPQDRNKLLLTFNESKLPEMGDHGWVSWLLEVQHVYYWVIVTEDGYYRP